jgi:hypothetical protein
MRVDSTAATALHVMLGGITKKSLEGPQSYATPALVSSEDEVNFPTINE